MKICIFYTSPKLGDLILQLPFIKAISKKYQTKVSICINAHINIRNILEEQDYIDEVIENYFRRGRFFFPDLLKLISQLRKKKFDYAYILEKTKAPAIASIIAKIENIYGFGIGSQKFFVNSSARLHKKDLRYNYTEQSIKFLNKLKINVNFQDKFLDLNKINTPFFLEDFKKYPKPWVCFGVDSTETNRIWPQKNFSLLADKLIEKNLAKTIFVISAPNYENYFENIITYSKNSDKIIDCKKFNRNQIIHIIDFCHYFVGIDSGPSCVAGALQKKTFCIIGATDATLPRFNSIVKIKSDIYDSSREIGINRCGDNFLQNNSEVKTIKVEKVLEEIKSYFKNKEDCK